MKTCVRALVALGILAAAMPSPGREINMDIQGGITFASAYVWRGRVINEDTVFQPEILFRSDPFSFNVWGTWDIEGKSESSTRTRVDFTLDYMMPFEDYTMRLGAVAHAYHDDPGGHASDTYELYTKATANMFLNPTLALYFDFGTIDGLYGNVSVDDIRSITDSIDLEMAAGLGFGSANFNKGFFAVRQEQGGMVTVAGDKMRLIDLSVSVAFPYSIGETTTLQPKVEYVRLMDSSLRDIVKAEGDKAENVVASLTLAMQF